MGILNRGTPGVNSGPIALRARTDAPRSRVETSGNNSHTIDSATKRTGHKSPVAAARTCADREAAGPPGDRRPRSAPADGLAAILRRLAGPRRRPSAAPPDPSRDDATPRESDRVPIPRGEPIGYAYDPVPKVVRHDRRLKAIDHQIVAILVSLAIWRRDSCWTTVAFLASGIAAIRPGRSRKASVCDRTIQRSLKRLIDAGHLIRRPVPIPDPDDPRNTSGYRYFFPWQAALETSAPAPRGVTKDDGEGVAKAPSIPPQAGGGVTKESGDSLVTQIRSEVLEQEQRTFNVANVVAFADPGKEASMPTGPTSPPVVIDRRPAGPMATTTIAAMPVAGPLPPDPRRTGEARALVRLIRSRGVHLWPDGDAIRAQSTSPGVEAPRGDEAEALGRLRVEVLVVLQEMKLGPPRVGPGPAPASSPEGSPRPSAGRPAPRVADSARAEVRRRIAALASSPDRPADKAAAESRPEARAFADALVGALNDRDPVSLATATGIAADVLRGDLAVACLQAAFEEACGVGKRNRGAAFVAAVRRWMSAEGHRRRTADRSSDSPAGSSRVTMVSGEEVIRR